jgi:hypothetical protein
MKKYGMILFALLVTIAFVAPAFAVEFKYGGLYRLRWQSNNNVADGKDSDSTVYTPDGNKYDTDDNGNWIDQRLRLYFTFIASERLQLVTKWEVDTRWGHAASGGDVGADSVNYEMKNVYIDFMLPYTPTRARLGVQGFAVPGVGGWMLDDDFSMARFTTPIDPVTIDVAYIGAKNENVTDESENIDDWFISIGYNSGPISATLSFLYQYGHDEITQSALHANGTYGLAYSWLGWDTGTAGIPGYRNPVEDNNFFDLGLNLSYEIDWVAAHINYVQNFGDYKISGTQANINTGQTRLVDRKSIDYDGWMVDAGADFFYENFTFTLGGFIASGAEVELDNGWLKLDKSGFVYPNGASHYWSEIMGMGTLDVNVGDDATPGRGPVDHPLDTGGYTAGDKPSNLWTINAGVAWQALAATKLTLNYWYLQTHKDVFSEITYDANGNLVKVAKSKDLGHELDFYLDQDIVDGLKLRFVAAYLFTDEAYSIHRDDDDVYEVGAQLQWAF